MSYVAQTIEKLRAGLGPADGTDEALLRLYALLVHTTGVDTELKHVHDAWALWRSQTKPDHADLVRFEQLSDEVVEYDRPYMALIRHVAAEREHQHQGGW